MTGSAQAISTHMTDFRGKGRKARVARCQGLADVTDAEDPLVRIKLHRRRPLPSRPTVIARLSTAASNVPSGCWTSAIGKTEKGLIRAHRDVRERSVPISGYADPSVPSGGLQRAWSR